MSVKSRFSVNKGTKSAIQEVLSFLADIDTGTKVIEFSRENEREHGRRRSFDHLAKKLKILLGICDFQASRGGASNTVEHGKGKRCTRSLVTYSYTKVKGAGVEVGTSVKYR
ncbi:hypothetical protein L1887_38828 [Cichorium endivia]|nr:hypothetical protein L1887_38828 [Cichorium endivia]